MACMEGCLPGGTRPNTPHHHMGLWLQATVQMRLCRGCAQGGGWWKRVGGRAGARQGRTAQNSRRMFVFAATLVPRRRDIRHENVRERGTPGKLDVQRAPWIAYCVGRATPLGLPRKSLGANGCGRFISQSGRSLFTKQMMTE